MVVKCTFQRHLIHTIPLSYETKKFGEFQFKAIRSVQGNTKKLPERPRIHLGAVGSPEQVIDHPLAKRKAERQRSWNNVMVNSIAVFFHGKSVDFELIPQQGSRGTAKAQKIIPCHGGIAYFRSARKGPNRVADIALSQTVAGNSVQQRSFFHLAHGMNCAGGEREVDKGIDSHMIRTTLKSSVDVHPQVLKGLPGQGKDEIHRYRFKGNLGQSLQHGLSVYCNPAQDALKFPLKRLDANTEFGHSSIPQNLQYRDSHIVRVQLHPNSLSDDEILL